MDYEKKYFDAIKRLKQWDREHKNGYVISDRDKFIFPELKESEDERIRKKLIESVKGDMIVGGTKDKQLAIAWLEKQGEQKHVEIKPIFEVGDVMRTKEEAEKDWKDGMPVVVSIDDKYYHCNNELIAIKDQYDYEYPPMNRKRKPVEWSEKDDSLRRTCIGAIQLCNCSYETKEELLNWLKSLKDRCIPQPKQEWSEEDEKCLLECMNLIATNPYVAKSDKDSSFAWLKSLRHQSKQQWTEKERNTLNRIRQVLGMVSYEIGDKESSDLQRFIDNLTKPQSHWKPTKGQIMTLEDIVNTFMDGFSHHIDRLDYSILKDLLEQLKAL